MTLCCHVFDLHPLYLGGRETEAGSSAEANLVQKALEDSLEHYLGPRLEQVISPIVALGLREMERTPAGPQTVAQAIAFARLLPRTAPIPEVSSDPDGEISFDWLGGSGKMFSVSISASGRLSYAGWFGEHSRVHGTEELANRVPKEILHGIWKTGRQ